MYNGGTMETKPPPPTPEKKVRVIDSLWTFLVAVACLGPFALPLLWRNPRYSITTKVAASVAVILFTWFLFKAGNAYLESILGGLM
jgi:hypothetical protein